jgi:hypothetical protein
MNTKIYSIFPACGKTWLYEHQEDYGLKILDSDSSQFSWVYVNGLKERNPDFPHNYISHIKENIGKYDCIFVSSHESVRKALDAVGIHFTIVYPESSCKAEWVGRCFIREKNGESGCSAEAMYANWEAWVLDCFRSGFKHREIMLRPGEYLSDYFRR